MRGDDDKVERDEQGHSQSDASPSSRNLTPSSSTCFLDERDMAVLAVEEELSFWQLIRLSLCLAGVQFTCGVPVVVNGAQKLIQSIALKGTVELAYGTPYLLSLGLPKALTALVWIAGPLSGILIQPLVGVYSDRFVCSYGRRRPFMLCNVCPVCGYSASV